MTRSPSEPGSSPSFPNAFGLSRGGTRAGMRGGAEAVLVFGLALVVRALATGIVGGASDYGPETDELYHLLAARSWINDGTFGIAAGEYSRAYLYTMSLGWLFSIFGESEPLARLANIAIGSLSVVAVFVWTRSVAGRPAAWIAALLYGVCPIALFLSGFIRFYALHGLAFWLGVIGCYTLLTRPLTRFALVVTLLGTSAALLLAIHLQLITLIGLAGLAVWGAIALTLPWADRPIRRFGRKRLAWTASVLIAVVAALVVGRGQLHQIFELYRWVAPWNAENRDNVLYYHYLFLEQYPTLWTLLPLAVVVALARRTQAAMFCVTVFGVAVLLHSFAGMKWERYVYYVLPFFFSLWGIVIAGMYPAIRKQVAEGLDGLVRWQAGQPMRSLAGWASLGVIAAFLLASNSAFPLAMRMVRGDSYAVHAPPPAWTPVREALQPLLDAAEVVLTTDGLRALYYLGRYDIDVHGSLVGESATGKEFGLDPRTGLPVISTVESLARVLRCYPTGLIISDPQRWRHNVLGIGDDAADFLEAHSELLSLPNAGELIVRVWERPVDPAADCSFRVQREGAAARALLTDGRTS